MIEDGLGFGGPDEGGGEGGGEEDGGEEGGGEEELQAIARTVVADLAGEGLGRVKLRRLLSHLVEESTAVLRQLPPV